MDSHLISPFEPMFRILWFVFYLVRFSMPALLVVVMTLGSLFARRGWFHTAQRSRAGLRILEAVIATLVVSVPLWMYLPTYFLPVELNQFLFVPAYAAALLVVPSIYWSQVGANRRRTPD